MDYRYAWQGGELDYVFRQLEILESISHCVSDLKVIKGKNTEFEIKFTLCEIIISIKIEIILPHFEYFELFSIHFKSGEARSARKGSWILT